MCDTLRQYSISYFIEEPKENKGEYIFFLKNSRVQKIWKGGGGVGKACYKATLRCKTGELVVTQSPFQGYEQGFF